MLLYFLHGPRRRIVDINLKLCFPQSTRQQRARIARTHFRALGQALFDMGVAWWASRARLKRLCRLHGHEYLDAALARGRGVILLAPHFVALELGGIALATEYAGATMFKDTRNAVVNRLFRTRRSRFGGRVIEHAEGLKPALRALKAGEVFYYLPDQDLGPDLSVFAPFFGIPTATVPALGRLARLTGAAVIPCFAYQRPHGRGYDVVLETPLENFPTGDELADAATMNASIERGVCARPAQYFWVHKRFKTRPAGKPRVY